MKNQMMSHRHIKLSAFCLTLTISLLMESMAFGGPNILLIAVDDMNDWIGCMGGHPQAASPNIDRLAKRGVLFTNAHCAAPACHPSRTALFGGRMPSATGVWSNDSPSILKAYPETVFLPMELQRAGYQTLGAGKLLGTDDNKPGAFEGHLKLEQRWSPFDSDTVKYTKEEQPSKGTGNPRHVIKDDKGRTFVLPLNGMPSDRRPDKPDGESFDWGPLDVEDAEMGDTQITDWAIGKIQEGFSKPFFMGVGYYRPHIPLWAPKKYFERFANNPGIRPPYKADDLNDLSETGKRWALEPVTAGSHATVVAYDQWEKAIEAYLACISFVDAQIGRLLDALDSSEYADNTIIVLWSDHGWHLGEKDHWGKWTGWGRSTRVPLIIAPAKVTSGHFAAGGSECRQPVGLIDLYPTLTELCDVKVAKKLDGVSLVPQLKFLDQAERKSAVTQFDEGNSAIRTSQWRYIRYADQSEELYNLVGDPNEWHNLSGDDLYKDVKLSLRDQLNTIEAGYNN